MHFFRSDVRDGQGKCTASGDGVSTRCLVRSHGADGIGERSAESRISPTGDLADLLPDAAHGARTDVLDHENVPLADPGPCVIGSPRLGTPAAARANANRLMGMGASIMQGPANRSGGPPGRGLDTDGLERMHIDSGRCLGASKAGRCR